MLKGIGDLAKMGNMLKQAMEMKQRIEEVKENLGYERLEAAAGGGMVRLELTGKMEVLSVKIDPEVINPNEPEVLETLVRAAVNEGIAKARELAEAKMREVASGLDIPGLT
ncbi:MAG TPA: YbaB/EbfC family nucleoid-associated protein [Candidatus Hydrogenedentes bacterium]|nr:YbaB/EbfC family nucleoid-associated protein [Candidatus Hydrogenedentota bacterium]